ncbi:MAG: hypothetical protein AAFR67_11040, partial [Chloroflexota bacterium]
PDHAEYDEQGHMTNRPMIVPAIGEGLDRFVVPVGAPAPRRNPIDPDYIETEDGEMLPIASASRPRRTGYFTPDEPLPFTDDPPNTHHTNSVSEMQGEEMEQHVSDVMHSSTGVNSTLGNLIENEQSSDAEQLTEAANRLQMVAGQLQVSGTADVASVLGDVVRTSDEGKLDYFTASERMATVMGMTSMDDGRPAVRENLPQFGLYLNQALRLGLSGQQTEQVVREVHASPSGETMPETRAHLVAQLQTQQGYSHNSAHDQVNWLEHTARHIPNEIRAVGMIPVPTVNVTPDISVEPTINVTVDTPQNDTYEQAMNDQSAMSGSGSVLGGDHD